MNRILACFLILSVLLVFPVLASDTPWFDFEHCAMCKPIMEQSGLMDHCTFEAHDLSNGMMTLVTVEPDYAAKFAKAGEGMQAVEGKLKAGEKLPLCGQCQDVMALMAAGAKMDEVMTEHGSAMVMTSTDAKGQLHVDADWAKAEDPEYLSQLR